MAQPCVQNMELSILQKISRFFSVFYCCRKVGYGYISGAGSPRLTWIKDH